MEMLIETSHIMLDAPCQTKAEVLEMVSRRAEELGVAESAQDVLKDLFARENEMATGINGGFAIPHTKSPHVRRPAVMFVRMEHPVEWETLDGSDVKCAIALMVPSENEGNVHLKMIAHLAGSLMDPEFTGFLTNEESAEKICESIADHLEM